MEARKKNPISIIFMIVGVIFVVVAGSIFVTTAWQYLPETVKQMCLLLVAGGFFGSSYLVSKKTELGWIENILYYLGTAFIGFFVLAVLGGVMTSKDLLNEGTYSSFEELNNIIIHNGIIFMVANLFMLVPVGFRTYVKKKGFDFSVSLILLDLAVICAEVAFGMRMEVFTLIFALLTLALSAAEIYVRNKMPENEGLELAVMIGYIAHGIFTLPLVVILGLVDDAFTGSPAMLTFILVMATAITYKGKDSKVFRIINSATLLWFSYVLAHDVSLAFGINDNAMDVQFAAFIINLVIAVLLERKEMLYTLFTFSIFVPFVQLVECWDWNPERSIYLPFSFAIAIAYGYLWMKNRENDRLIKLAGAQAAMGMITGTITLYSVMAEHYRFDNFVTGYFALHAVIFTMISILLNKVIAKQILKTIALINGVAASMFFADCMLKVPEQYLVEADCAFVGIAIVLLGYIWYDKKKGVRIAQFVMTCMVLAALLLHNMDVNAVGNMFILAITALVMLFAASKKERKEYVIVSAATLIIMAIYLTKGIWLSISWWVYLFVVGVILIALAIKKEHRNIG